MPARAAIVAITGRSVGDPGMEPNYKKYINTLCSKYEVGKKNITWRRHGAGAVWFGFVRRTPDRIRSTERSH
jgi:hypothetical protein